MVEAIVVIVIVTTAGGHGQRLVLMGTFLRIFIVCALDKQTCPLVRSIKANGIAVYKQEKTEVIIRLKQFGRQASKFTPVALTCLRCSFF